MQHRDPIWGRNGICHCFGGGSSTPKQTQPTTFDYSADRSNTQQRQAALLASTNTGTQDSTTFGSSLGTGGGDAGAAAAATGGSTGVRR